MWPIFWLNFALAVLVIGAVIYAMRRIEHRFAAIEQHTASMRNELLASIRDELARHAPPAIADEWTSEKNARRIALIDREIDEIITPEEAKELETLQQELDRHVERVAPLPLDYARELHQQLLEKAAKAEEAAKA